VKKVQARHPSITLAPNNELDNDQEYTVVFEAGPIGLQLEPAGDSECRVQRFVDGGPKAPGPARMTGKIRPGDTVVQVNGQQVLSHDAAVNILKNAAIRRVVTFKSAWTRFRSPRKGSAAVVAQARTKTPIVPGMAKRTPSSQSVRRSRLQPVSPVIAVLQDPEVPQRLDDILPHAVKDDDFQTGNSVQLADSDDFEMDVTLIQAPEETVFLSNTVMSSLKSHRAPISPTRVLTAIPHASPPATPPPTLATSKFCPAKVEHALSPSRVKNVVAMESKTNETRRSQSISSTVLKTVYKGVVPTAGIVASGSYTLGSILSHKLGEALVGHSSKEFDSTVELKIKLLQELGETRNTVDKQQATIHTLLRDRETERLRLRKELETTQSEKKNVEIALEVERERATQLGFKNEGLRRSLETSNSKETIAVNLQAAEIQAELEEAKLIEVNLQAKLHRYEEEIKAHNESSVSSEKSQGLLESAHQALEEKSAALERTQTELESKQTGMLQKERSLRDDVVELQDRLEGKSSELAQAAAKTMLLGQSNVELTRCLTQTESELSSAKAIVEQSQARLHQVEDAKKTIEQELHSIKESSQGDQAEALREQQKTLARHYEEIELELTTIKAALADADSRHCELEVSKSSELEALQEELLAKDQALTNAGDSIKVLKQEKDSLAGEVERLRTATSDAKDVDYRVRLSLQEANSELFDVKASSVLMQRLLSAEQEKRDDAEQQIKSTKDELHVALRELESGRKENTRLSAGLIQTEANLEAAASLLDTLEEEKNGLILREARLRAELEKKRQSLLQDSSAVTEASLTQARSEIADLQRQIRALESSKALSQRELEYLSDANDEMVAKLQELRNTLEEKQGQLTENAVQFMAFASALEDYQVELRQKKEEIKQSQTVLQTVQTQYSSLSERLSHVAEESSKEQESMSTDLIGAQEALAETKARSLDLEQLLRSMRRTVSDSEARASNIREQLHKERQLRKEVMLSTDTSRVELEKRIAALLKESETKCDVVTKMKMERDELRSDNESMEREMQILTNAGSISRAASERRDAESRRDREELSQLLAAEKTKAAGLSESLCNATRDLDQAQREVDTLQRRYEVQTRDANQETDLKIRKQAELLQTNQKTLRDLHQSCQELVHSRSEVGRLEDSLQRSRGEVDDLSNLITGLKSESTAKIEGLSKRHSSEIGHLEKEKKELECSLQRADGQIEGIRCELYTAQEGLARAQIERERLLAEKHELSSALHIVEDALAESELRLLQNEKELSCDEITDNDVAVLSRSDLQFKCVSLQDELEEAKACFESTKSDVAQRNRHIQRLEQDLAMMSDEIAKLIVSNGKFDQRLKTIKSSKEASDADALSSRFKAEQQEKYSQDIEDRLVVQQRANETLVKELESLQTEVESARVFSESTRNDLVAMRKEVSTKKQEKDVALGQLTRMQQELKTTTEQKTESSRNLLALEADVSDLHMRLSDVEHERDGLKNDASGQVQKFSEEIKALVDERSSLLTRLTELEVEAESSRVDLGNKNESERTLLEELESLRCDTLKNGKLHEEAVLKLAQTSRMAAFQRETIAALEARSVEAERTVTLLSEQTVKLQSTIKKLETSSDESGNIRMKQLQGLERKCSSLDKERNQVRSESNDLRDELRQARREATEYQHKNESLQTRIDTLKESLDQSKSQLQAARASQANTTTLTQTLENELDSKRMEADHLKAKIQVLSATTSRLKSDYVLLQDATLQAEFKNVAADDRSEEVSRFKSELHTTSSKLESLSEVYRSQREVLALSQSLEEQLLTFIEDIITHAETVFSEISDQTFHLEGVGSRAALKHDLNALDLAGLARPKTTLAELQSCLDDLSCIIPSASSGLSERRAQLKAWRERRSIRLKSLNAVGTPNSKSQTEPVSPGVLSAFQQMKRVFNEEVFSPGKARRADASKLDAEYFHK